MKTKRVVKLSELHQIIGNYLYMYGDANITSIATHTNGDPKNHLKYSLHLAPIDRELEPNEEETILGIDYYEIPIKESISSGFKYVDEPLNGHVCECCGNPVHSTSATTKVCNKCASEYQF